MLLRLKPQPADRSGVQRDQAIPAVTRSAIVAFTVGQKDRLGLTADAGMPRASFTEL
jgi:hypothetical protein